MARKAGISLLNNQPPALEISEKYWDGLVWPIWLLLVGPLAMHTKAGTVSHRGIAFAEFPIYIALFLPVRDFDYYYAGASKISLPATGRIISSLGRHAYFVVRANYMTFVALS